MNLTDKIFHDDEAARKHLEAQRWPDGAYCPHCGECEKVTELKGASTKPGTYICKSCRTKFTVTVGTIFERSHIGLAKWTLAFRLMASSKKGISALQLSRTLDVTYKTAWFMAHRIREAMNLAPEGPLGGEGKVVEADETYVGGKRSNMHAKKRQARDLHADKKLKVVTLVERDGHARSFHVASVTAKTLRKVIVANASRKSHLMTDGLAAYHRVGSEFASHRWTDHVTGEYARVSRAVRITIALQSKLIADFEAFGQSVARARRAADMLVGQDRPARVQRVARIVERVIVADQALTDERFKDVCDEASRWLDDETLSGDLDRPFSAVVADICRDLGLSPDWAALAEEGWARDEAAGRRPAPPEAPAAPAARPWPRVKDEKQALAAANAMLNAAFAKPPRAAPPHPSG